ncbi:uncharacterized protein LOC122265408 [Penaeus japonicus]|uniref:uncharacterized protein LOC122265408 n=1 Tax=Penaeus japonicus TaxID=27405 RepID=UPI001C7132A1|nr:uncharacterized protein LOC122265408 [Penaeus japonicus]
MREHLYEVFAAIIIFAITNIFIQGEKYIGLKMQQKVIKPLVIQTKDIVSNNPMTLGDLPPQNDLQLISYVRHVLLKRPSRRPYDLRRPDNLTSDIADNKKLNAYLKKMAGGMFVEAYAGDGETRSSTLYLERHDNWSGLLVEPDPALYTSLLGKGRRSFSVNANLSLSLMNFTLGRINSLREGNATLPLHTLVRATGMPEVDFLCLHTGGTELQILKTFPWIDMTVRIVNVNYEKVPGGLSAVKSFLGDHGFNLINTENHGASFVRGDFVTSQTNATPQQTHALKNSSIIVKKRFIHLAGIPIK